MADKKYLTAKEAMDEIKSRTGRGVSKYSFYSWIKSGLLHQKRLGKTILIAAADLDIFLADFTETSKQFTSKAA
jgi:hypothetical protein